MLAKLLVAMTDFYEVGNACVTVEDSYYSPSAGTASLSRQACTNAGDHGTYTSMGGGTDNCSFTCHANYHEENSTCMNDKQDCSDDIVDGNGEKALG